LKNISKQTRRKYKEGFKTEALRMVTAGRRTADIARSLGIREYLLYKWRAEQKPVSYSDGRSEVNRGFLLVHFFGKLGLLDERKLNVFQQMLAGSWPCDFILIIPMVLSHERKGVLAAFSRPPPTMYRWQALIYSYHYQLFVQYLARFFWILSQSVEY
jgi:hypothetical protein